VKDREAREKQAGTGGKFRREGAGGRKKKWWR